MTFPNVTFDMTLSMLSDIEGQVQLLIYLLRPGSVVVERSPGMRDVGGLIPRPRQTKDVKI